MFRSQRVQGRELSGEYEPINVARKAKAELLRDSLNRVLVGAKTMLNTIFLGR
jgi:hypothetical protein